MTILDQVLARARALAHDPAALDKYLQECVRTWTIRIEQRSEIWLKLTETDKENENVKHGVL